MKRYYLAAIYQSTNALGITAWVNRVQDHYPGTEAKGGNILQDTATGAPVHPAILVMISGTDHTIYQNDPQLVPIPDVGIDGGVGAIAVETKLATKAAIIALGFNSDETETVWQNSNGMRAVLNHYGRKNNPDFDTNDFDLYQN